MATAERSLEMSQRAYLHVSNGEVTIGGLGLMQATFARAKGPEDVPFDMFEAYVRIAFDVENSGNTSAEVLGATLRFDNAPGWLLTDYFNKAGFGGVRMGVQSVELPPIGNLAPKTRIHREHRYPVTITRAAAMEFLAPFADRIATPLGVIGPLRILAEVSYRDDFGKARQMTWCWHSNRRSQWALECEAGETTPFVRRPSLILPPEGSAPVR